LTFYVAREVNEVNLGLGLWHLTPLNNMALLQEGNTSPVDMLCMSWPLLCWCKFHLHIAENKKLKINYRKGYYCPNGELCPLDKV
jgi:hypothetical protein